MKSLFVMSFLMIVGLSLIGEELKTDTSKIKRLDTIGKPVAVLGYVYPLRMTLQKVLIPANVQYEKKVVWVPPQEYNKYSVIFIDGRLKSQFTKGVRDGLWKSPEDKKAVEDYLSSGGVIILTSLAFYKLGNPIPPMVGFSLYEGLVDAKKPLLTRVVDKTSPVTSFLKKDSYRLLPSVRVGKLDAGTKVLMEYVDEKGRKGPLVTERRIGKGALYWFSSTLQGMRSKEKKTPLNTDEKGRVLLTDEQKNTEIYRQMLIKAVLSGKPAKNSVENECWSIKPLGKEKKLLIAKDGFSNAVIVLANPGNYQERHSAQTLKQHLDAITKSDTPVVKYTAIPGFSLSLTGVECADGKWKDKTFIIFGKYHKLKKLGIFLEHLGPEGIVLRTIGNTLVVAGKDDRGVSHSVYTFLELLGCRYLWPGELGKVIPEQRVLEIGYLDLFEAPRLWRRYMRQRLPNHSKDLQAACKLLGLDIKKNKALFEKSASTSQKDGGWFVWQRMGSHKKVNAGHAFGDYWTRFGKEHLKWFALQPNGSRNQAMSASRPRFCHANQNLVKQIIKDKIEELRKNPSLTNLSIALNDGGLTTFCMCEKCRELDPVKGMKIRLLDYYGQRRFPYVALTDRVLRFSNMIAAGVAEEFPNKQLVFYAYSGYASAPVRTRPHHNLIIYVVDGTYESEFWRGHMRETWRKWTKYGNDTFWRPNLLLANRRVLTSQNFSRKLFDDFRYCYNRNLCGTDFDTCAYNWALNGLIYYVLAKAHWNPNNTTYDDILNDYCSAGFGNAVDAVKSYFLELERLSNRAANKSKDTTSLYDVLTPDDFVRLRKCLSLAKEKVAKDPNKKLLKRIEFLVAGLRFSELNIDAFNESRKAIDSQEAKLARKKLREFSKIIMTRYPLAVNIPYTVNFVGHNFRD